MAQKSGYLYKKGLQSSGWQQRLVTLNTDTGTMKFFAEKSGNKVPKGQVCIKQGKLTMLDLADTGHAFAFEIRMEELIGKSDEAVQILSVDTQQQLDQWLDWIGQTLCTEKRKGSVIVGEGAPVVDSNAEAPNKPQPLSPQKSLLSSMFPQIENENNVSTESMELPITNESPNTQFQKTLSSVFADLTDPPKPSAPAPAAATASESGALKMETEAQQLSMPSLNKPAKPVARKPSRSSIAQLLQADDDGAGLGDSVELDSPVPPADANSSPDGKNLADKLEAKLDARRKIFKPPNFRNLLNSNGFDQANRRSAAGSETGSETDMTPPSRTTASNTPVPPELGNIHPSTGAAGQHDEHHHRRHSHHGHGHGHGHGHHGHGHEIADSNRASAAPSPAPNTDHHSVVDAALAHGADALAPRRSFTKSPARRRTSKKAAHNDGPGHGTEFEANTRSHTPSPTPHGHAPLTRHIKISVRPTEPVRTGYLYRLDSAHSHDASMGSDVWLTQFVSLDITTGMMHVYAEINGKRIQRAKFDINESSVKSIDQLFHSRLYCFKVSFRPEDPNEKKVTAVFAAEDEDTLNYWLVSFEDCEIYFHTHNGKQAVAGAAAATAGASDASSAAVTASKPAVAAPVKLGGGEGGGKINPADLANALRKRGGGIAVEEDDGVLAERPAPANPLLAALHSRFASAPANVSQHTDEPVPGVYPSISTESFRLNEGLQRVDSENMDQLLTFPKRGGAQHALAMEAPLSDADRAVSQLKFAISRVKYPSERLSRRIKVWYCSSGFSIASASEVEQFVKELRNTGDAVLSSFAEEKFTDLQDWANLLAVLRKYEQRRLIDSPVGFAPKLDGITFEVTPTAPPGEASKPLAPFQLKSDLNTAAIAAQMSKELGATESLLAQELPRMLLNQEDNVVSQGLTLLNEDLAFAEDLILYQEEVISNVWSKYVDLHAVVDEKEDTISKLYAKLSQMQQANKGGGAGRNATGLSSISHPNMDKASWHTEKEQILLKHTEEKLKYITEIQMLRKSLTPSTEQILKDLRQVQHSRDSLETEVIHTQSRNDELRAELASVKDRLQAVEEEKSVVEAHWLEEIAKLKAEHERHAAQLREETRKAQIQTKRAEEAVLTRRNSEISIAIQQSMQPQQQPQLLLSQEQPLSSFSPPPSPPAAPPTASTSAGSLSNAVEAPKSLTMVSRFASPKRQHSADESQYNRPHKTYVNMYAVADEQQASTAPSPVPARAQPQVSQKLYNPYNYSMELKEEAPPISVPKKESPQPWIEQYFGANTSSGGSVAGSVGSRREELIDPEDENQEPIPQMRFTPPMFPQQDAANSRAEQMRLAGPYNNQTPQPDTGTGLKISTSAPNLSAQQQSLRLMRLPQSGTSSPMTPLTTSSQNSSAAPSPNPNGLQVPRSMMKANSIRGLIQKQNSTTVKVAGPYMAPHGVAYTEAPLAPSSATTGGSTGAATAAKNFMSSTKAVKINQQLLQESAKEKFLKKFTFNKTAGV